MSSSLGAGRVPDCSQTMGPPRSHRRRWLWLGGATLSLVMVVTLAEVPAFAEQEEEWRAPDAPEVSEVEVSEVAAAPRSVFGADDAVVTGDAEVVWPQAGLARASLAEVPAGRRGVAEPGQAPEPGLSGRAPAGDLPVRVGPAPLSPAQAQALEAGVVGAVPPAPAEVGVLVADRQAAQHAGVAGVVLGVARSDGEQTASSVVVELDYSGFRHAYGGDWASRLGIVVLGECGDSFGLSRSRTGCQAATPVPTGNDYQSGVLTAQVPVAADGGYTMLAVTGGESGDNGDYTATSLEPAGTWQVSQQTGAFSWSHPLRVVPGLGGPEPNLALSYSSQAVDGRTTNTNTQGSWIGDGWDLWPGYIERSYQSCAQDTDAVNGQNPNNKDDETGDQCWFSDNASMSLNGRATELVKDGANRFRGVDDDGSRIERLTNTSLGNGTHNGEYWRVTTVDGTQYYFGRNRRQGHPSDSAATNSTWTVPVYGNHPGEPCYQANNFAGSRCTQGWRWNLDYIVDPHGNTMTLFYSRETGAYGREGDAAKRTTYHRGGHLDRIEYGTRAGSEHQSQAPYRVMFDTDDRCKPNATCNQSTPSAWPDTPWDQYCASAPCTDQLAPTFWTQKRLDRVRAQVLRGGSYSTVESWRLEHQWLDAGDSDGEAIPMWLKGITRTGHVTQAGGQQTTDPQIVFDPGADPLPNRVKRHQDGFSSMNRWRLRGISTESGAYIGIGYSESDCSASNPPTPHTNKKRCYPQWYAPSEGWFEPEIHWFHKYVVTVVSVHDTTGASPTQETHYDYQDDPAWAYADSELVPKDKRTWSQWRGYSEVRVRQGVQGEPQSATEYLYLRGMHGDRAGPSGGTRTVSVTDSQGRSVTDHEAHAGFLLEETVRNGPNGAWVSGTINTPWRHGPTATAGPLKAYLTDTGTVRTRTNLGGGNVRWTRTVTEFDTTYGLPTQVDDRGDEASTADDLCIRYEYARNTSAGMVDRVSRTETVNVRCAQTPSRPADVVSDERTFYDNPNTHGATPTRGLPVRRQEVGSWNGSTRQWVTTETTTYDVHGRAVTVADPLGRTTTTAYTPATGGPVTRVAETNPAGHTTTETREPAWQLPVRIVDANSHVTDLTYDGSGRLTAVWLPGRERQTQSASARFDYLLRNNAPTAVTTRRLLPDGQGYQRTVALYDGMLRERQTQTQAPGGGRVITDEFRNSRGELEWTSERYYNAQNPSTTLVGTAGQPQIPGLTEYRYDGAGRVTDEIFKINGQEAWRSRYAYGGDRTHLTPPVGGTATTTVEDARGRTTAVRAYHAPTPSGAYDETTYTYTPRDEYETVADPMGNVWSYEYDQRGRQIAIHDPDQGTSLATFDAAGQEITVTDARGETVANSYDALGRRTSVREGSPAGPLRAEWVYDTLNNGVGKLSRAIRHREGAQYVVEVTGYTTAGQPTGNRIVIPSAETGLAGSYEVSTTYRANGAPATTTLPAAGGLPQERLVLSYDDVGEPTGMTSPWGLYTYSVTYDKLGNLTQRVLGEHGKRVAVTHLFDEATGRLMNTSAIPELRPEIMDIAYQYNDAGNLVRLADSPGSAVPSDTQCYRFDYLQRVTDAWTPASGAANNCAASPSVGSLGGPAPYWHAYTFDQIGNRLSKTARAPGAGTTVATYTHPPAGSPQPHTVTEVAVNAGSSRVDSYEYDESGNLVYRSFDGTEQTLTWDAEGFLSAVTESDELTEFIHDADGNRLIRRDPTGSTLYLPGGQEVRYDQATGQLTCTRYYEHLGTVIAVRTPQGLTWQIADHHGTAEVAVDATTLQVGRKRTTPFGGVRGAQPAVWAGDKGFVGGTKDPTGLVHLGARMYDPNLGRFISVDPIIDPLQPQQMHGYAYSNNNPGSFLDDDGLFLGRAAAAIGTAVAAGPKAVGSALVETGKNIGKGIVEHSGTISTVLGVAALACMVLPPPAQAVGAVLGAASFAFGVVDTVNQCASGNTIDCGLGVAGLVPGVKGVAQGAKFVGKAYTAKKAGEATSAVQQYSRSVSRQALESYDRTSNDFYWRRHLRASDRFHGAHRDWLGVWDQRMAAERAMRYSRTARWNTLLLGEQVVHTGGQALSGNCSWQNGCMSREETRYGPPAAGPPAPQPQPKPKPSNPGRPRGGGGGGGGLSLIV